jgi:hypothetical protein
MNSKMKEILKQELLAFLFEYHTRILRETDVTEWIRYDLEDLALFADVPSHLEPMCRITVFEFTLFRI